MKTQNLTPDQKSALRRFKDNRRRELTKPEARVFPKWHPRMSTRDYIERYNVINRDQYQTRVTLDFIPESLSLEPAQYNPLTPLCFEEIEQ